MSNSDDQQNLPDVVHKTALTLPVAEFEGEYVRIMEGKLPSMNLEMEAGYPRGTHLKLELEVRVKSVTVDENRRGDLVRLHQFALEEIKLLGAYTADDLDPGVGGSASVEAYKQERESDERPEGEEQDGSGVPGGEVPGGDARREDGSDPGGADVGF